MGGACVRSGRAVFTGGWGGGKAHKWQAYSVVVRPYAREPVAPAQTGAPPLILTSLRRLLLLLLLQTAPTRTWMPDTVK